MRGMWVVFLCLAAGCASPPPAATAVAPRSDAAAQSSIGALAPAFRDYRLGTLGPRGAPCTPSGAPVRYVQSLDSFDGPPTVFGLDAGGCVSEIRYAMGGRSFDHALALATSRLGAPAGEDQAVCDASGEAITCTYWERSEGRFETVQAGADGEVEYVLRPDGAPFAYGRLCEGGVRRE